MKNQKLRWGILLIGLAVFLILSQLDLISKDLTVWNILLGGFFAFAFVDGVIERSFPGMFIPLAFLWIIFDETLGLPVVNPWVVMLIAILLSSGLCIIFPKKRKINKNWQTKENNNEQGPVIIEEDYSSHVYCSNKFGATSKYVNTKNLQSVKMECVFGELKVFFDQAVITKSPVQVEVQLSFGHIQMYIPKSWAVMQNANVSMGSVDEKGRCVSTGAPIINLVGDVNLGELTIIYV